MQRFGVSLYTYVHVQVLLQDREWPEWLSNLSLILQIGIKQTELGPWAWAGRAAWPQTCTASGHLGLGYGTLAWPSSYPSSEVSLSMPIFRLTMHDDRRAFLV